MLGSLLLIGSLLVGCASERSPGPEKAGTGIAKPGNEKEGTTESGAENPGINPGTAEPGAEISGQNPGARKLETTKPMPPKSEPENSQPPTPTITESDWSEYFDGLNGTAVLYDASNNHFMFYQKELALTQSSPCSTFKIISSMIALENGILQPEDSTYPWSGEIFWNENWNQDMDFEQAFSYSCVWYFRKIIDEIGQERMQEALEKLSYGNCDISDWEGRLNTNNNNRALTGFWIESSLKICPREQAAVMKQIFDSSSAYSPDTLSALEEVMFLSQDSTDDCKIYGKTGMGKSNGIVVDAWYTGFADADHRIYFCVYLGETAGQDVSSARAREIAVSLIKQNY